MAVSARVTITQNSQSVTSNTSSVTVKVIVTTTGGSYNLIGAPSSLTISGSASGTYNFTSTFGKQATKTVYTKTLTVSHAADGTAKVTAKATIDTQVSSGTITASATKTLSTIPRASSFDIVTAGTKITTVTVGDVVTIGILSASTSFRHTLRYAFGSRSSTIASNVVDSHEWTVPSVLTSYMPDSTSGKLALYCDTYSGSTKVGTKSLTLTCKVPSTAEPSITSHGFEDASGHLDTYGVLLTGKSKVRAWMAASGYQGSTVELYRVYLERLGGDYPVDSWESDAAPTQSSPAELDVSGFVQEGADYYVAFVVRDSRGRADAELEQVGVWNYRSPRIVINAYRYDSSTASESDESTTIRVEVSGSTDDVAGKGDNVGTVKVRYRIKGASTWTTLSGSTSRGTSWNFALSTTNKSTSSEYEFEASVTDEVGTTVTATAYVGTAKPVLDLRSGGGGLGIFAVADRDAVRVGAPLSIVHGGSLAMEDESGDSVPWVENAAQGRPTIVQHTALGNDVWLQAVSSSGSKTNLLSVDGSNITNLSWTMPNRHSSASLDSVWGLGGRVYKELWSGYWGTGDLTVTELPYYNLFAVSFTEVGGDNKRTMLVARTTENEYPDDTDLYGSLAVRRSDGTWQIYSCKLAIANVGGTILRASEHNGRPLSYLTVSTGATGYCTVSRIRGIV